MNNNDSWANFALTGAPIAYLLYKQRKGQNPDREKAAVPLPEGSGSELGSL